MPDDPRYEAVDPEDVPYAPSLGMRFVTERQFGIALGMLHRLDPEAPTRANRMVDYTWDIQYFEVDAGWTCPDD